MERYLKESLLSLALGGNDKLPSADELAELISEVEVELLFGQKELDSKILNTAWYLFTIASVKNSANRFGVERQRAAYQVAGHIFDLFLRSQDFEANRKYCLIFAAQISYIRSNHQPNAMAILRKNLVDLDQLPMEIDYFKDIALTLGIALLGFDIKYVYKATKGLKNLITKLESYWDIPSIFDTPFGSSVGLALGTRDLVSYLLHGNSNYFEKAKELLLLAVKSEASYEDVDCRWMASLLLEIIDELKGSNPWTVLPSSVPDNVKKAFTLGSPKVLSLWPPQIDYLSNYDPFSDDSKFQFISTPTSGGKTLISQIILAHHLATRFSSACYIAPTRSLCREVENSMKSRFRYLNLRAAMVEAFDGWIGEDDVTEPEIIISTPEALASKLRKDPESVFSRIKLFVFDEVHSIGDPGRGLNLEHVISLIKSFASRNDIRIVMVSAVIGNRAHFISWLGNNGDPVLQTHSDWRGPRRINAIWSSSVNWRELKKELPMKINAKSKYRSRKYYDLYGNLTVRTSLNGRLKSLKTLAPIGELVMKIPLDNQGRSVKDDSQTTTHNQSLIPLINTLVQRGPVLCIESTKLATISLAKEIADSRENSPSLRIHELVTYIEGKLSSEHPLSRVIKKGVAYHHSSLPSDIKNEIEQAVSEGHIDILVATTTMTEGVNLPVQSVIISHTGTHQNDSEFLETIKGPKMANAIGRAGRATKETEGYVVLCHKGRVDFNTFKAIDPDDDDKFISSNLISEQLLKELELYEERRIQVENIIFDFEGHSLSDFISFIWFYLYINSSGGETDISVAQNILKQTMFWIQSDDILKNRIQSLMTDVVHSFNQTNPFVRKLLSKSSAKLKSTLVLRRAFDLVADRLLQVTSSQEFLSIIFNQSTLDLILSISEAPKKTIFNLRNGRSRHRVEINLLEFLNDWIGGLEYPDLANKYLHEVNDVDFRYEQLGDFISNYFDNFFPWVINLFIDWTNEISGEETLPNYIPGLVRSGVPTKSALTLINQGIPSRSLAVKITEWMVTNYFEVPDYDIRNHLRNFMLKDLYEGMNLSTSEFKFLKVFLTEERVHILSDIISSGVCRFKVWFTGESLTDGYCELVQDEQGMNYKLVQDNRLIAYIPTRYHSEMDALFQGGIPVNYIIHASEGELEIHVET